MGTALPHSSCWSLTAHGSGDRDPRALLSWRHIMVPTPFSPWLPLASSRHSEKVFSSSRTATLLPPTPNKGSETVTRSRQKTALIWPWLAVLRQGYVTCDMISSIHTPFPQKNLVVFAQPTDVQQAHLWVKWTRNTVYGTGPHCVWRQEAVRTGGLEARCWLTLPRMGHRLLSDCWVQDQLCPYWVQDQLCPYWRGLLNFPFLMSKRTPTSNKVVHIVEEEKQWLDFSLSGKLIQIYIWQFSPDKGAIPWWLRW